MARSLRIERGFSSIRLPSLHHPANHGPCRDACCERGPNRQQKVSVDALSRVIYEFFGRIAAMLCDAFYRVDSILDRVANCTGCT
jgi:hypothetical protein